MQTRRADRLCRARAPCPTRAIFQSHGRQTQLYTGRARATAQRSSLSEFSGWTMTSSIPWISSNAPSSPSLQRRHGLAQPQSRSRSQPQSYRSACGCRHDRLVDATSGKMESEIERAHTFVLDEQGPPGPGPPKERHSIQRFARIDSHRASGTREIATARIAAIQSDVSGRRISTRSVHADDKSQRFHFCITYVAKPAMKRAGIPAPNRIGAKVDAVVFSKREAGRQKSTKEQQNCRDWRSSPDSQRSFPL